MRVLLALTYFRPHVSGLTIYVERLGHALAERGHQVTVLTSQYEASLPREESSDGVRVVRVPVAARVSKGVLMPTFGPVATRMVRSHDVVSIHLPQFDAAGLALRGRVMRRPVVLTYHCDLQLPPGAFNRLVDRVVFVANLAAGVLADRIVAYTQDYADHSPLLSRFRHKLVIIPPPVVMAPAQPGDVAAFAACHALDRRLRPPVGAQSIAPRPLEGQGAAGSDSEGTGQGWGPVVGFAARFATEKGVEYLLRSLPELLAKFPRIKVLFAGPYQNVLGEEAYYRRLAPVIEQYRDHWEFLGTLTPAEMPAFFANCDVLVVPSINSTESFGLVQVEAMLSGTPVVASNLPGVRQPVRMTGMGEIVPVADAAGLADGILKVLEDKVRYVRPREEIEARFDIRRTVEEYEELFESLVK